jgi:membrane protein
MGLFTLVPILASVVLAFFRWDIISAPSFVGFDNFATVVQDPTVRVSFLNTIVFVVVAVALVAALPAVLDALDLPGWVNIVVQVLRWIMLLLIVVTALGVLYRWAPEHGSAQWQWLSFGAIVATLIWVVVSVGFSVYVDNFGNYAKTYGSLAGVAVLMLWLWLSAYAALFGAEVNAEALALRDREPATADEV